MDTHPAYIVFKSPVLESQKDWQLNRTGTDLDRTAVAVLGGSWSVQLRLPPLKQKAKTSHKPVATGCISATPVNWG